ncbi:MAG: NUDIX hydrolase [Anaerolineaceae bacterium]|nr:NUDIX hydrolase [Anaerolineaceae bacterium]
MKKYQWLEWVMELQAHAQNGLTYSTNPFDVERYEMIREIAVNMLADMSSIPLEKIEDLIYPQEGYATPKIDIRGVVFLNDRVLLVKEVSDGGWTLPGGWVDIHESPSVAVEREVWEESGFKVKTRKLLAVQDRNLHGHPPHLFHIYRLFFQCEITGGEPATSLETDGVDFFSEDNLPNLSLSRTTPAIIQRLFYHFAHPDLPTDFD